MTDSKIQSLIAEKCGWKPPKQFTARYLPDDPAWSNEDQKLHSCPLPDYPNDLNAMREAAMTLSQDNTLRYWDNLNAMFIGDYESIDATAHQRAEAFLKVFGLWK